MEAFGSGNVFADLGVPNPDEHLKKSRVVAAIAAAIRERGLTHSAAATAMGIPDNDLAKILRGQFRDQTLERISGALTALPAPELATTQRVFDQWRVSGAFAGRSANAGRARDQ